MPGDEVADERTSGDAEHDADDAGTGQQAGRQWLDAGDGQQRDGHRDEPDDDRAEALQDRQLGPDLPRLEVVHVLGEARPRRRPRPTSGQRDQQPAEADDAEEDDRPAHQVGGLVAHEDGRHRTVPSTTSRRTGLRSAVDDATRRARVRAPARASTRRGTTTQWMTQTDEHRDDHDADRLQVTQGIPDLDQHLANLPLSRARSAITALPHTIARSGRVHVRVAQPDDGGVALVRQPLPWPPAARRGGGAPRPRARAARVGPRSGPGSARARRRRRRRRPAARPRRQAQQRATCAARSGWWHRRP